MTRYRSRFWFTWPLALALSGCFGIAAQGRAGGGVHSSGGGSQPASVSAKNSSKGTSGSWRVHIHPNMLGPIKPSGTFKPNKNRTDSHAR